MNIQQTSFLLPIELNQHAVDFISQPTKITSTEIKSCARELTNISLVNKDYYSICQRELATLKKLDGLVNKYCFYNRVYENQGIDWRTGREFDPKGNPHLLDALYTECGFPYPFDTSTFKVYTPEIENDIKEIVRLTPQSMSCILGIMRCRTSVLPLAVACNNEKIPLHIVEFLLQQGANPNATLKVMGRPIGILTDLENKISDIGAERFAAIKALFIKYGAVVD